MNKAPYEIAPTPPHAPPLKKKGITNPKAQSISLIHLKCICL